MMHALDVTLIQWVKHEHKLKSASFLVKERTNNNNLDTILFVCSRGVEKSCFTVVSPRTCNIWAFVNVMLKRYYAIKFSS